MQAQAAAGASSKGSKKAASDDVDDMLPTLRSMMGGAGAPGGAKKAAPPPAAQDTSVIIGIDLGTTYSCVGVWQNDRVEIVANTEGSRTTASVVGFTDHERLIGAAALAQAASNSVNTVYDAKRLIGRNMKDHAIQDDLKRFPFKVTAGAAGEPIIHITFQGEEKAFAPE
jgi:L1 cell adhesion molecule like protein